GSRGTKTRRGSGSAATRRGSGSAATRSGAAPARAEPGSERDAPRAQSFSGIWFGPAATGFAIAVLGRVLVLARLQPGQLSPLRFARYKARRGDQPWPENRRDQEGIKREVPRPPERLRPTGRERPAPRARVAASPQRNREDAPRRASLPNA